MRHPLSFLQGASPFLTVARFFLFANHKCSLSFCGASAASLATGTLPALSFSPWRVSFLFANHSGHRYVAGSHFLSVARVFSLLTTLATGALPALSFSPRHFSASLATSTLPALAFSPRRAALSLLATLATGVFPALTFSPWRMSFLILCEPWGVNLVPAMEVEVHRQGRS